jgi:hypothetical protein
MVKKSKHPYVEAGPLFAALGHTDPLGSWKRSCQFEFKSIQFIIVIGKEPVVTPLAGIGDILYAFVTELYQ